MMTPAQHDSTSLTEAALHPIDDAPIGRPHDLRAAIEAAATDANDLLGLTVELSYDGQHQLPAALVGLADELVRAAFDNAARHAGTSWVHVDVNVDDDLWVRIRDHGRGFQLPLNDATPPTTLSRISAAAAEMGGALVVVSAPGQGIILRMKLPLE